MLLIKFLLVLKIYGSLLVLDAVVISFLVQKIKLWVIYSPNYTFDTQKKAVS